MNQYIQKLRLRNSTFIILMAISLFLLCTLASFGQGKTQWTGLGTDNLWSNPANWSSGVPTATMPAVIKKTNNDPYANGMPVCLGLDIQDTLTIGPSTPMNVYGDLNINGGAVLNMQSNTSINITGNWTNNGLFIPSTSTIRFSGAGTNQLAGTCDFFNLIIAKTGNGAMKQGNTVIRVSNNLNVTTGWLTLKEANPAADMIVSRQTIIGNGGGIEMSASSINLQLGGNLIDNNTAEPSLSTGGLYCGSVSSFPSGLNRASVEFNGAANQLVQGAYTLRNAANTLTEGSGIALPNVIINKTPGSALSMFSHVRICGAMTLNTGTFNTNGYNLLFGDRNNQSLDVYGEFYLAPNSKLKMSTWNADGTFFQGRNGGLVRFLGDVSGRAEITRDGNPGNYYRMAVYAGCTIESRFTDFNFQGASNTGFPAPAGGTGSNGGIKIYSGATIDPINNFSDCSFSAGATGYTALTINTGQSLVINNAIFNGSNGNGINCVSNSTGTSDTLRFGNSSGLIGGPINGEANDGGAKDGNIIWSNYSLAYWTGASNISSLWSDPKNWSTNPVVPGTPGNARYDVVIRRTAPRHPDIRNNYSVLGTLINNYNDGAGPDKVITLNNYTLSIGEDFDNKDAGVFNAGSGKFIVGGNFFNHYPGSGFICGTSTVEFNGSNSQQIRIGTSQLYDFIINKPMGIAQVQNNVLTVNNNLTLQQGDFELYSGNNMVVNGNITQSAGTFFMRTSTVTLLGNFTNTGGIISPGTSTILFTASTTTARSITTNAQPFNIVQFAATATPVNYNLLDNFTALGQTTINAGNIVNNTSQMKMANLRIDGRLNLGAGGETLIAPACTLNVNTGGRMDIMGNPSSFAKVSRQGSSGSYTFVVTGSLKARYYMVEFMDSNGLDLSGGGTLISPAPGIGCFSDGIFTNGMMNGTFLKVNQTMISADTIFNTSFPTDPGQPSYNVSRTGSGNGHMIFKNAVGLLAGENFDMEMEDSIRWITPSLKRWDGGAGTLSWNDAANWRPDGVPAAGSDVVLDHTYVASAYSVQINAGPDAACRNLTINTPIATPINLDISNTQIRKLTVAESYTSSTGAVFTVKNPSTLITIGKNFSSNGTFIHGNGTVQFASSGISVINTNNAFFNVKIRSGVVELNDSIQIKNNLVISSGATLDASIGNKAINIEGLWIDSGQFVPRYGTVNFVGAQPQTITKVGGPETFYHMSINKPMGDLTLNSPVTVNPGGLLDLTNGKIFTSPSNVLVLDAGAGWANASAASFVNGPMGRTFSTTGQVSLDYPIGKNNQYLEPVELAIGLTSNTKTVYTMEQFNAAAAAGRAMPAGINVVSPLRHWEVKRYSGSGNISKGEITLRWNMNDGLTPTATGLSILQDNNPDLTGHGVMGNAWTDLNAMAIGTPTGGYITSQINFTTLGNA
ncbi:MAG: hypothetical protein ACJ75J_08065, partial [Cytophagaceae bacterium]